ncbi:MULTISPECIES: hypothetical protein [Legionella]|uniref:Uncharacterized protein n=1 Tax=Legionella maceachernii TaxID=466 RepID=A0A0W0VZ00_9GAMM|nr:hypothetical protein [Legionella maceachernii]KTD25235.1 hypothetical protein Lmac_2213 [Legionella maceachernii]SJZ77002.1 hypothetical protein SAMN02745128_01006 [Legionella maceachernii]SUP03065.1 Uncharacterised protein [Legionella maceachernii]
MTILTSQSIPSLEIYLDTHQKQKLNRLFSKHLTTKIVREAKEKALQDPGDNSPTALKLKIALNVINRLLNNTNESLSFTYSNATLTRKSNVVFVDKEGQPFYYLHRLFTKSWYRLIPFESPDSAIANVTTTSSHTGKRPLAEQEKVNQLDQLQEKIKEELNAITDISRLLNQLSGRVSELRKELQAGHTHAEFSEDQDLAEATRLQKTAERTRLEKGKDADTDQGNGSEEAPMLQSVAEAEFEKRKRLCIHYLIVEENNRSAMSQNSQASSGQCATPHSEMSTSPNEPALSTVEFRYSPFSAFHFFERKQQPQDSTLLPITPLPR